MKKIICSERSPIAVIHIGCIFSFFLFLSGIVIYKKYTDVVFFVVILLAGVYLLYLVLCFINVRIIINDNGIECKNFLNFTTKYAWNEIVVTREKDRGAAIVFEISRKRIRVYSYYKNYNLLNEYLKKSKKYDFL